MTTLVAGSAGVIGTAVVAKLAEADEPFVGGDVRHADETDSRFIDLDVSDYDALADAVDAYDIRRVIHLAAVMKPRLKRPRPPRSTSTASERRTSSKPRTNTTLIGRSRRLGRRLRAGRGVSGRNRRGRRRARRVRGSVTRRCIVRRNCSPRTSNGITTGSGASISRRSVLVRSSASTARRREQLDIDRPEGARDGGRAKIPEHPEASLNLVPVRDVATLFYDVTSATDLEHATYNTRGHRTTARQFGSLVESITGGTVQYDGSKPSGEPFVEVSHRRAKREYGYDLTPLSDALEDFLAGAN